MFFLPQNETILEKDRRRRRLINLQQVIKLKNMFDEQRHIL